jgi:hypothetical protein
VPTDEAETIQKMLEEARAMREELQQMKKGSIEQPSMKRPNGPGPSPQPVTKAPSNAPVAQAPTAPANKAAPVATVTITNDNRELSAMLKQIEAMTRQVDQIQQREQRDVAKMSNVPEWLRSMNEADLKVLIANNPSLLQGVKKSTQPNSKTLAQASAKVAVRVKNATNPDGSTDYGDKAAYGSLGSTDYGPNSSIDPISDGEGGGSVPQLGSVHPFAGKHHTDAITGKTLPVTTMGVVSSVVIPASSSSSSSQSHGSRKKQEETETEEEETEETEEEEEAPKKKKAKRARK